MARFLFPSRPASTGLQRREARPVEPSDAAVGSEGRRGPGWFDSSWELHRGLVVREGWPDDVRLDEWLDGFCGGRRGAGVAALAA